MTLQHYIDFNWYTVPLQGILQRNTDGKKTTPIFEFDWKTKYTKTKNQQNSKLGGVLTGKISNIIALDCDNQATYDMVNDLSPNYAFCARSIGKSGGTFIYKYNQDISTFSVITDKIKLEVFSDAGFIYLPTTDNKTKQWLNPTEININNLQEIPATLKILIHTLILQATKVTKIQDNAIQDNAIQDNAIQDNAIQPQITSSYSLAYSVNEFIDNPKNYKQLFKYLTPHYFKDLDIYATQKYILPNDIPQGEGSNYLMRVSAILGADKSINKELYYKAMIAINNMWENPMDKVKLENNFIYPMINEQSKVNSKPIWQYNKKWQNNKYLFVNKNAENIECFFDPIKQIYFIVNHTLKKISLFPKLMGCIAQLQTLTGKQIQTAIFNNKIPLVNTIIKPNKNFGYTSSDYKEFNIVNMSLEMKIINNPEFYAKQYKSPDILLNYFISLIPNATLRNYIFSFLKTKYTTFDYSPIVLYFIGTSGSGKDTFVSILRKISGESKVLTLNPSEFLDRFNDWIEYAYFVQLTEFNEQAADSNTKKQILGKIKAITGRDNVFIRPMYKSGYDAKHYVTLIFTANKSPIQIEENNRRIVYIDTPYILANNKFIVKNGGMTAVYNKIMEEIPDFCYYLATQVNSLSNTDYTNIPINIQSITKDEINKTLEEYELMCSYINDKEFAKLELLAIKHGVPEIINGWQKNRIHISYIYKLYRILTDSYDTKTLDKILKYRYNLHKQYTTLAIEGTIAYLEFPGAGAYIIDTGRYNKYKLVQETPAVNKLDTET